jgi:hypothetical protein
MLSQQLNDMNTQSNYLLYNKSLEFGNMDLTFLQMQTSNNTLNTEPVFKRMNLSGNNLEVFRSNRLLSLDTLELSIYTNYAASTGLQEFSDNEFP